MKHLLDTSVIVHLERGRLDLSDLAAESEGVFLPALTHAELEAGVALTPDAAQRRALRAYLDNILLIFDVLPFDRECAVEYGRIVASVRNLDVGRVDLMIAATAIRHGLRLVAGDRGSFPLVPNLDLLLLDSA